MNNKLFKKCDEKVTYKRRKGWWGGRGGVPVVHGRCVPVPQLEERQCLGVAKPGPLPVHHCDDGGCRVEAETESCPPPCPQFAVRTKISLCYILKEIGGGREKKTGIGASAVPQHEMQICLFLKFFRRGESREVRDADAMPFPTPLPCFTTTSTTIPSVLYTNDTR